MTRQVKAPHASYHRRLIAKIGPNWPIMAYTAQKQARGPTRLTQAYEISKSTGFQMDFTWISGFHEGFTWISGFHVDFWISDLFLSSIIHYRPIRTDFSNEASVIACVRRLNLSSHQNYVAQTLAG